MFFENGNKVSYSYINKNDARVVAQDPFTEEQREQLKSRIRLNCIYCI